MQRQLFGFRFPGFGGQNEIQLYADTQAHAETIFKLAEQEAKRIEAKYSRYLPSSLVSQINASAGNDSVDVDDETAALLDYADASYRTSDGLFDITSGVLRRIWDFKIPRVPSQSEIEKTLQLVDWQSVEWKRPSIRLPRKGMEIDFGGFGKEYAVDRLAQLLTPHTPSALINLGGDVKVLGPHPNQQPWTVGITHPRSARGILGVVHLHTGALATSGDYERFFELDNKRYCHILNPTTAFPAQDFQSVTVLADSCLIAGTAATTTFLLGSARGKKYLKDLCLPHILIGHDGSLCQHPELIR